MKKIKLCLVGLILLGSFGAIAYKNMSPYNSAIDNSHSLQGFSSYSIQPLAAWNKTYGGTGDDYATSIVQTSDGGYAIAGYTHSFGAGAGDFWLVKTDALGNMEWNRTYGGTGLDGDEFSGVSVIQTSDEGFTLAGTTHSFGAGGSDFWLVKTDSSGNVEWNKTYGGSEYEYFGSVVQSNDGGYALIGGTRSFGAGWYDFWLVRTDSIGNVEWNKTYGRSEDDIGTSIIQTADGGYAVAGSTYSDATKEDFWLVKTDGLGNLSWSQNYGGSDNDGSKGFVYPMGVTVIETNDGSYLLTGNTYSFGAEWADFWLVKASVEGKMHWSQMYGGPDFESSGSIASTTNGYIVAGTTGVFGDMDAWLVKTDLFGIVQWNQTFGGPNEDFADCVVQTSDGGYAIAGSTGSFGAGGKDFWLVKLQPEEGVGYCSVADLNRDGIVDAFDLFELAKAYGSSLDFPSQPGKTVVAVLSLDKKPPELENARVAIIDSEVCGDAVDVKYTNSSGIAAFELSSNKRYTAIAWSGSSYNFANFTTDSLHEASVLILLGELSIPSIRAFPKGWVLVTILHNATNSLYNEEHILVVQRIEYDDGFVGGDIIFTSYGYSGVYVLPPALPPSYSINKPHSKYGLVVPHDPDWWSRDSSVYSPDVNGCANVVVYVTPP